MLESDLGIPLAMDGEIDTPVEKKLVMPPSEELRDMSEVDIRGELKEIKETLNRVDLLCAAHAESNTVHAKRITNLEMSIFGNGTEGLKVATIRLQQVLERAVLDIESGRRRVLVFWVNVTAAVSAVAALIGVLVVLFR